jgi:formylglycine-generating enzyme required for sulfatase activity
MNAHKMVTAVFVPDLYISPNPGDLATLDGMPFVWCPSGTFSMGDPEFRGEPVQGYPDMTPHLVTLTEGFWMGQYEVTRQQWTDVMGTEPWRYCELPAAPTSPAVCISWTEAAGVAGFLENLNERSMDATFRLPTEAEWEYACRADMTTRFYWGDDPQLTEGNRYAWTAMNAGRELQAVGLKLPNAWNLYDMSGNAWEFVQDWFDTYPTGPATDPTGPQTGTYKAIRGGGIDGGLYDCMSFWRGYLQTTTPVETMGFRIVAIPRDVASY